MAIKTLLYKQVASSFKLAGSSPSYFKLLDCRSWVSWLDYQLNTPEASGRGSAENRSLPHPPSPCMVVWLCVCVYACVHVCVCVSPRMRVCMCSFVCLFVFLFLLPLPTIVGMISPAWWCWMWGKWRHFPPGYMDSKPSALGGAVDARGLGTRSASQSTHLCGPPAWCMVEVQQPAYHTGASTNT